jgi:hypothetical protein
MLRPPFSQWEKVPEGRMRETASLTPALSQRERE